MYRDGMISASSTSLQQQQQQQQQNAHGQNNSLTNGEQNTAATVDAHPKEEEQGQEKASGG
eukprot:CAMPEP_0113498860 /NCGR_PEP_ID=MMETSP0014_2-20120614/31420_1 /TAXON_ID=2857 /ORGANISM="Nitzschia sp." /LENGTH=60 /DNA_ID=CAMNT_0000392957 /DNA_START=225 /DNA_END=404 /DNA_ORIENTATION=- /assembly_acc=CAM_ASM_000159